MSCLKFCFDTRYLDLPCALYAKSAPAYCSQPELVLWNAELARDLKLTSSHTIAAEQLAPIFSGNSIPKGATPFSQAYAGHQFGHFTVLGDGRCCMLGEHKVNGTLRVDIQLKGSGPTCFSRSGDGRAALGPMLREYIVSEAMHALGVPTTRSLAVVKSGDRVFRETALPGALLTRTASSHIRVGTFEFACFTQDRTCLEALFEHTVQRHYPHLETQEMRAELFLEAVMEKQIDLIVQWMRVGFVHGVMNTDNTSIAGETLDYGPCAFLDDFHMHASFSAIDSTKRYAFGNQPQVLQWNMQCLAKALLPLIDSDASKALSKADRVLSRFSVSFEQKFYAMMAAKLGLVEGEAANRVLVQELFAWMQTKRCDYTQTFYDLTYHKELGGGVYEDWDFKQWYERWQQSFYANSESVEMRLEGMRASNPVVIARNHQVEKALSASYSGDLEPLFALLQALKSPYKNHEKTKPFQAHPKPWERVWRTYCGT